METELHVTNGMSEESVLRYRLEVVQLMPDGPYKSALIAGINASFAALRANRGQTTLRPAPR
jgi:hypothetical protein